MTRIRYTPIYSVEQGDFLKPQYKVAGPRNRLQQLVLVKIFSCIICASIVEGLLTGFGQLEIYTNGLATV